MTLNRFVYFTIILTYFLIVFGGYVASSESGMGCGPEWPLCNGAVIPILQGDTLIEFAHRVIGAVLGIMTVILFIKLLRAQVDRSTRFVSWVMLFLLVVQILFGAIVVILDLPAIIVTAHLVIAMLFLASLIWIGKSTNQMAVKEKIHSHILNSVKHKIVIFHLNIATTILLLTLAVGAYIKHESYGLACGWLSCGESLIPATIPEFLQTTHRFLAIAATLYIFLLIYWSYTKKWGAALRNRLLFAGFLVLLQIIIGVLTVITYIDIPWAVLHLAAGTALFASVYEARAYVGVNMPMSYKPSISSNEKFHS
ncbi:cytochrome c oxidase assembly protein subunit 15 [Cytobacillus eiseniae]|uniref:Cytochrome c oxidase assembly protein subunit 15 n=1 Tax=Cytobacillus eiseniae TaxID=762947 RepID=A0ABS4RIR3_9BACI|nr:COX15/CtaA family protein [Cytobacillus eiseniae]MBP2242800.1 cytochrome c oxidase assembly protein subunit 15 [Cytobacillus eiseniae]